MFSAKCCIRTLHEMNCTRRTGASHQIFRLCMLLRITAKCNIQRFVGILAFHHPSYLVECRSTSALGDLLVSEPHAHVRRQNSRAEKKTRSISSYVFGLATSGPLDNSWARKTVSRISAHELFLVGQDCISNLSTQKHFASFSSTYEHMNFYELFIFHIFVFSYLLIFLMGGTAPVLAGAPRSRSLSC